MLLRGKATRKLKEEILNDYLDRFRTYFGLPVVRGCRLTHLVRSVFYAVPLVEEDTLALTFW